MLIKTLVSAYPRQELKEDTIKTYVHFLKDLDFKLAERVIAQHIRTQKWLPTIAEIREAGAEAVHYLPTTEQAMAIVREASRHGSYRMVAENELLSQAVDTVGWQRLVSSECSDPLFRQIKEAYDRLRVRELHRLTALPQVGQLELGYSESDAT